MGSFKNKIILIPFMLWMLIFIIAPFILMAYYSLTVKENEILTFSFDNFIKLTSPLYVIVMLRSLWIAFVSTLICLLIGYPIALILAGDTFRSKAVLLVLLIAPMWMNFLLRTYAWLSLLENTGLINQLIQAMGFTKVQFLYNQSAVVMGMVYNLLPFMIFPIYTSISKIPKNILEAAEDLGANSFVCFVRIILPQSLPGIISGITMVFVPGVTIFVISKLLGGGNVPLIGDMIEQMFGMGSDWNLGSAISMAVMVIVIVCMWFVNKWSDDGQEVGRLW